MRVADICCCQGGAAAGYAALGWDVTGVDINPQPRFPWRFVQADAVSFIRAHGREFGFIHISPPCQAYSDCQRIMDREHPSLIEPARRALEESGVPYVIENVGGAVEELRNPVMLCGQMFGVPRTYRHRYFEAGGWDLPQPEHPEHTARQAKMGRAPAGGEFIHAVGNFSGVQIIRDAWNVPWMNRDGIREAIPPVYSEWIGRKFLESL
jgi:DNA (cytosine-5)-methyltransferase 1